LLLNRQNERVITEQQKLIANLQRELMRLQKRLSKVELEGVVQPSIMFTRLDAQRNEETLRKAVEKGKISDTKSTVIRIDCFRKFHLFFSFSFLFCLIKGNQRNNGRLQSYSITTICEYHQTIYSTSKSN